MTNYSPSPRCIKHLQDSEGCAEWDEALQVFLPYADSGGISTIGRGHRLTHMDIQTGVFEHGLSQLGCDRLFEQDLAPRIKAFNNLDIPGLKQGQVDGLFDLLYNAGMGAVKTVLAAGLANAPTTFMHFIHDAHGNELKGLVTRREQDIKWWLEA